MKNMKQFSQNLELYITMSLKKIKKKFGKHTQNKIIDARNHCLQGTKLNFEVGIYYKAICCEFSCIQLYILANKNTLPK